MNALRACFYEFGHVCSAGNRYLNRIKDILDGPNSDLPELMREECGDLMKQIAEKTVRIDVRTAKIKALAAEADTARRLQTIPGVGPLTALAVEAFAPPMESLRSGRDFAAWLGLVPRQFSSGGKERLGRVSKAGQSDIRRLLIVGAMSRLNWLDLDHIAAAQFAVDCKVEKCPVAQPTMLVEPEPDRPDLLLFERALWTCFRKVESFPEMKGELDDEATTIYEGV